MRFSYLFLTALLGLAAAHPATPEVRTTPLAPQTVHLVFHAGPVQYELAIPADGKCYSTSQSFPSLSLIFFFFFFFILDHCDIC